MSKATIKPVIVMPIYKELVDLTCNELISLSKCLNVLHSHSFIFVGPKKINWTEIENQLKKTFEINFTVIQFSDHYFQDLAGYNKLLISEFFYKKFTNYTHLLICQLDAYVFKDELNYWCKKKYDYIGAPWCGSYYYEDELITGVGNGGFSLRSIKGSQSLLKKLRQLEILDQYRNFNDTGLLIKLPILFLKLFRSRNEKSDFARNYSFQEDVFWGLVAPKRLDGFYCYSKLLEFIASILLKNTFKIAPVKVAAKFSFETNPRELFKLNNDQLPFGCHAWDKYDPEFWKTYIYQSDSPE
jgi:hypothetical protein